MFECVNAYICIKFSMTLVYTTRPIAINNANNGMEKTDSKFKDKGIQVSLMFRQESFRGRFVPPLRKQSSGDLQSRLKTRKLLGVGECEDGSVPVSKISQILGNDDHYLLTLPNGLRLWQVATALVFSAVALLAIMFPVPLFDVIFASNCGPDAILPIRLFGAALSCLGLLFWSAVKSVSRYIIRWTLLSQVLYLSIQATVMMCTLCGSLSFNFPSVLVLLVVVMAITISLYFYAILSGFSAKWLWKPKMIIYDMPVDKND